MQISIIFLSLKSYNFHYLADNAVLAICIYEIEMLKFLDKMLILDNKFFFVF